MGKSNFFVAACSILIAMFAQGTAVIASKPVAEDSKTLVFEKAHYVGDVMAFGNGAWRPIGRAQGAVVVPANTVLRLMGNRELALHPESIDKLPSAALWEIHLNQVAEDITPLIPHITRFKTLTRLTLSYCELNDSAAEGLAPLINLVNLDLRGSGITGSCFKSFSGMKKLATINVCCNTLKSENLKFLAQMPSIFRYDLDHSGLTDIGVETIAQAGTVRELNIGGNNHITKKGLIALLSCHKLETLDIRDNHLPVDALLSLKGLSLRSLQCRNYKPEERQKLKEAFPKTHISYQTDQVDNEWKELFAPLH